MLHVGDNANMNKRSPAFYLGQPEWAGTRTRRNINHI